MVVSDGHVEGGLHGNTTGVVGERFLRLQVGIGPLLKQLRSEARQPTATCGVKWALPLSTGRVDHLDERRIRAQRNGDRRPDIYT